MSTETKGRPPRPKSVTEMQALEAVLDHFGNRSELARRLGVSRQALYLWYRYGIPSHQVKPLEKLTGISRKRLRPDLYEK